MKIHVQPTEEKYAKQAEVFEKLVNQPENLKRIESEVTKALIDELLAPRTVGLGYFRLQAQTPRR